MSLRWKVAGILFAILLLYVALAYAIASRVVFSSFEALERKEAEENLQRCVSAIWREVQQIQAFAYDWASWDDTYRFVETRDPAYVETNLADTSFVRNSLGYIGFVNAKNRTVWSRAVDTAAQADLEVPELSREIWPQDHPLLVSENSPEGASGILLTASGPLLAASRPILTSMNEGPSRGTLIMGAFLNERLVETLRKQVGVQFRLFSLSVPGAMPRDMQEIAIELESATNAVFRPLGMKSINAYGMLRDLNARPALLVEAVTPRSITLEGTRAQRVALGASIGGGAVLLLGMLAMLRRTVVDPIASLTGHVVSIGKHNDLSARLALTRTDEIGTLAREFDAALDRLDQDRRRRENAEHALRDSEARLRAILNTAPDAIFTLDTEKRIASLNEAASRLFGYEAAEAAGMPFCALVPGVFEDASPEPTGSKPPSEIEIHGVRKDGSRFPIHLMHSAGAYASGAFTTVIVRDITALKHMHERVLRAQNLALLGQMGASVAHEVRNPLAAISGAIQVFAHSLDAADPRRDVLVEVLAQTRRMEQTINELLQFARPWRPHFRPFDLVELLQRIVAACETENAFAAISFRLSCTDSCIVVADPDLVHQVTLNLFQNASQAMVHGGTVSCHLSADSETVRLHIKDDGPGIPAEAQARIFEPFFTTRARGTGLGLPICKQIMEAHGGTILLRSEPGDGVEIILEFPKGA